ncbi:MAG: hypothetical protein MJK18_16105, partial [Bdellovibrionales bacterium]|nr:hypothetical protein [Bdellovibrionales bacterium]
MKFLKLILLVCLMAPAAYGDFTYESLPVQEAGRIKPMITVAQETLQMIHGKSKYEGKPALDIISTWMLVPEPWADKELIKIDHHGLKQALGFDKTKKYFSVKEVGTHPRLNIFFSDLSGRLQRKEKLNAYYQAIQRMETQLLTFYGISQGGLRIFPPKPGSENNTWLSIRDVDPEIKDMFFKIMSAHTASFVSQDQASKDEANVKLKAAIDAFVANAQEQGGELYPAADEIQVEVHYQKLKPFFWTWVLYLLASLLLALSFLVAPQILAKTGVGVMALAFIFHTYGFALRCIITG